MRRSTSIIKIMLTLLLCYQPLLVFCNGGNARTDKYVFFLHSRFTQLFDLETKHPEYGKNEYLEIVQAFKENGLVVISEKRPPHTEVKVYARKVVSQIDSLLKLGVKPNDITIIGTSMGGYIAQYVSSFMKNADLNFVFIGCYQESDLKTLPDINWCGNILSIYAIDDSLGVSACNRMKQSKLKVSRFVEIALQTKQKHGFLYHPLKEWIWPSVQWAKGNYAVLNRKDTVPVK